MIALLLGALWGIAHLQGPGRHEEMTNEEFEREVQNGATATGQIFREIQGLLEPDRNMEYLQQLDKKAEGEQSEKGAGNNPPAQRPPA